MSSRIKQAVAHIRQGNGAAARLELLALLKEDPKNADGWVLLAHLTSDRQRKIAWLEKAIALEPDHLQAQKQLSKIRSQSPSNRGPVSHSLAPTQAVLAPNRGGPRVSPVSDSTLLIDGLVERWLKVLSFTEFYVIKLLYGLEGESLSAESGKRVIGSVISLGSVEDIKRAALSKLREAESSASISPLRVLLNVAVREKGSAGDLEQVQNDIRHSVDTKKFELGGVIKLLLDVESESILSQKPASGLVSLSSPDEAAEPPTQHLDAEHNSLASLRHEPIDVLGLPTRIYNSLRRSGVNTVGEVLELYPDRFVSVRNLGRLSEATLLEMIDSFLSPEQRATLQASTRAYRASQSELDLQDSVQTEQGAPLSPIPTFEKGNREQDYRPPSIVREVAVALADMYQDTFEGLDRAAIESYMQHHFCRILGSVAQLSLSRRVAKALKRAKIKTIGQLAALSTDELREVRGIGDTALQEINSKLRQDLLGRGHTHLSQLKKPISSVRTPEVVRPTDDLLEQISVYRLGLTRKSEKLLENARARTLSDLLQRSDVLLLDPNIKCALDQYTSWLSIASPEDIELEIGGAGLSPLHRSTLQSNTVEELVQLWLSGLVAREQKVIRARYGLDAHAATLKDIGRNFKVTRERIRQIQKQALRRLGSEESLERIQPVLAYFEIELALRNGAIHTDVLSSVGLCGVRLAIGQINITGVVSLISEVVDWLQFSPRQRLITRSADALELVLKVQNSLAGVLEESMCPLEVNSLLSRLRTRGGHGYRIDRLSDDFLLACLRASPQIQEREPNVFELAKWKNRIIDEIVLALVELGHPSHFSLITEKVNDLLPDELKTDKRNVHAHLGRYNEIFVRVGHGIFGLARWGLHDDGSVANAAHRVLKEAGHPLHIDVITERVLQTWHVQPGSVNMAIQNDDRFVRTGQGVYSLYEVLGGEMTLKEPDFADLYGDRLAQWGESISEEQVGEKVDTHNEVDKLRSIGLDFFQ